MNAKKRILIITSSIDKTVDYILLKFSNKIDFFRLDVDMFSDFEFSVGTIIENDCSSWKIKNKKTGECLSKKDLYSIYYRKPMFPDLSNFEKPYQPMIKYDILSLVNGIVEDFEGKVLTKPSILRRTENKINQLLYAIKNSWKIPVSYIGNRTQVCSDFDENDKNKSIIKPISVGKIYSDNEVELFQTAYFKYHGDDISLTPVYLQKYVEKKYETRITVIKDAFYCVRIDTKNKLDWRQDYENHIYTLMDCPPHIKSNCVKLMKYYSLNFAAFDYIITPKDEWVFLEANPNGQWLWLEQALNLDISDKIVNFLEA